MGSNIIELAKLGHERAAELKASCGAVDVRSVSQLISDLASQLEVQYVRAEESRREFRSTDITMQNLEAKCEKLAAENSGLKAASSCLVSEYMMNKGADNEFIACITPSKKTIGTGGVWDMWRHLDMALDTTPETDAFLAEVRASSIPDEATERDLFEEWVMEKIFISKATLEGLRTDDGYRNSTLSGTDYNGMWSQWKAIRAAQLRKGAAL